MGYATLEDVRDEGVPASIDDARIESLLILAQQYIERHTGLFFERRQAKTYQLDGNDSPVLELPAPALTITALTLDGATVDATGYTNFNRPPDENSDDFWYPRLMFKAQATRLQRAFGAEDRRVWSRGERNVSISGDFGFVLTVGAQTFQTPTMIKRATILLASALALPAGDVKNWLDRRRGYLKSEQLGNYSYQLGEGIASGGATGDREIDGYLATYTRARGAWAA